MKSSGAEYGLLVGLLLGETVDIVVGRLESDLRAHHASAVMAGGDERGERG